MGTEASKPIDGPQHDFGQSGKEFQVISPMSDLSNPSDIHRLRRNRNLHNLPSLPNPSKKKASADGPIAPNHFYFPTKETEKAIERSERRNHSKQYQQGNKENEKPKLFQKTKKILKKTQKVMTACFTENSATLQEVEQRQQVQQTAENVKHYDGTLGIARKVVPKKSKSFDEFCDQIKAPNATLQRPPFAGATGHSFVIREAEAGLVHPEQYGQPITQNGNSATLQFAGAILHEADDYFSRLTAGSAEESPYVEAKTLKAYPSALGEQEAESPISNLFEDNMSSSVPSAARKSAGDSTLAESDMHRKRHSVSPGTENSVATPADSLASYLKAIGTIAETPGYYPDVDQEGSGKPKGHRVDNKGRQVVLKSSGDMVEYASEEMIQKATADLVPVDKSDDDSSRLSHGQKERNTNSAFRVKDMVKAVEGERNVSKLETLFRPVLPALSADDAETLGSYDPWQIKVTESAPGVLESKDYKAMALQRNDSPERNYLRETQKLGGSFSPSMLSIDSQVDATPFKTKAMVSDQARDNADFLFSAKGRAFLTNKGAAKDHGSISTLGSRSRVSSRASSKAVSIPTDGGQMQFTLMDAVTSSVGLAPKGSIEVPAIETKMSDMTEETKRSHATGASSILKNNAHDTQFVEKKRVSFGGLSGQTDGIETTKATAARGTPYRKASFLKSTSDSPFLRFQSARTKFEASNVEVQVPTIPNTVSDLSDKDSNASPREYSESVASEAETLETGSIVSHSMRSETHWAYNTNNDSVTPAFGKVTAYPTKSPFRRFENAKSKFGQPAVKPTLAKKPKAVSPRKKQPYKSPRTARMELIIKKSNEPQPGGSVASRIQELNQRVVAAKIDRKKHRWTKSNPRKYGIVESNAVRTRALVNYKTNMVGIDRINYMAAAKFNSIPIDDDESIDSIPERGSEAHFQSNLPALLGNDYQNLSEEEEEEEEEDYDAFDFVNKHDEEADDEMSKLTADDAATIATVRQEQTSIPGYTGTRLSMGSFSTTSSGFSKIKKQVFRPSQVSSASTTMSAILDKENTTNYPFRMANNSVKPSEQNMVSKPDLHLSPTQRTPMQAQKWRTLAAAAYQRDSQKKLNSHRGLAIRKSKNHLPAY